MNSADFDVVGQQIGIALMLAIYIYVAIEFFFLSYVAIEFFFSSNKESPKLLPSILIAVTWPIWLLLVLVAGEIRD